MTIAIDYNKWRTIGITKYTDTIKWNDWSIWNNYKNEQTSLEKTIANQTMFEVMWFIISLVVITLVAMADR